MLISLATDCELWIGSLIIVLLSGFAFLIVLNYAAAFPFLAPYLER
jgi:hypothetical protein